MLTLGDYIELTPTSADQQWARIVRRAPIPSQERSRQEDFTPVETILCFAGSLIVPANRYGGSTAHRAPTPVQDLAALFRRSPGSIISKMLNLAGRRENGAKNEIALAKLLLSNRMLTAHLYKTVIDAARNRGITEAELPDFMRSGLEFLDQDEVSDAEFAEAATAEIPEGTPDPVARETQTVREVAIRIGQYKFARDVLANCHDRCVFCGFAPGPDLVGRKLLRASHIKPWRRSSNAERVDVTNGLAACPTHDAAFDTGLLVITDDLKVELSPLLRAAMDHSTSLAAVFSAPVLSDVLLLPPGAARPKAEYLDWHRRYLGSAVLV